MQDIQLPLFDFVKDGLAVLEGTHIAENIAQQLFRGITVLSHPFTSVGIGAHGDDFTAQLLEPAEKVDRSEERRVGKECRSRWSPYH